MTDAILDDVFGHIDGSQDDLIALTQDLVRIPTVNPPGEAYTDCAEYLGRRLAKVGFSVDYIRAEGSPGDSDRYPRTNIVARYEGKRDGPCVHFNSHMDVVEAGKGWAEAPFAGTLKNGRVYGRGACDMKGGLAASILAAEALIARWPDMIGAIEISGTVDEESGGYGGVAYLAERGYFSPPRVDHVIIPEPLNKDRVCIGHRGVWWGELETHGRIAHGSMPFLGDCAIRHMGAALERFEDELFPQLAQRATTMPVVPDEARRSTMNFNSLHAGQAEPSGGSLPSPCVPDSARLILDRRFLIEETQDNVRGEIIAMLDALSEERDGFSYSLKDLFAVDPVMIDPATPVAAAAASAIEAIIGTPATFVCSPGTYDQKHIDRIGRLKNCIAYGPGILDLAHQPDEYVEVAAMVQSAKVMAQTAFRLMQGTAE